jgi:predicted SAM-dependent methyltransferase
VRLNLGCGHEPLEGWTNVDAYAEEADVSGDIRGLQFDDAEEVLLVHVLEHFSWRETHLVLRRIHGWMRKGATLTVEVPDMEHITAEAMHNVDWIRYLYGSQEHEGEYHRTGFTAHSLSMQLHTAGFVIREVERFRSDNPHRHRMPCLQIVATA